MGIFPSRQRTGPKKIGQNKSSQLKALEPSYRILRKVIGSRRMLFSLDIPRQIIVDLMLYND